MTTPAGSPATGSAGAHRRTPRIDAVAVGLIAVIFLTEAAIGVLLVAVNEKYPQARLHAGLSLTGFAFSFYFASKVVGQPLAGWLADRTEPRGVLIGGTLLTLPAIVLMERWQEQTAYIASWALFGLALAVVWPCAYAIIGRRFRASLQGRLLALISMGQIAGTAIGAGSGGFLIDYVSYRAAFIEAMGVVLVALVIAVLVVRGGDATPRSARERPEQGASGVMRGVASLRGLITPPVLLLALLIMILSLGVSMIAPDLRPYGERVLHLKYSTFLLLLVPPGAVAGALLAPAGYVADRFGRHLPMGIGLAVFALNLAFLTLTHSPVIAMLIATMAAGGYVLCLPALSASMLDLSTPESRGALTGFTTSIQAVGGVVGPPIGGRLIDRFGALAPFRGAAVLVLIAFALSLAYAALTRGLYERARGARSVEGSSG